MQVSNPIQMNDWEIKNFLAVVLAIQLAVWGVIGLDAIGLHITIARQLIGFIYLTFIPGIIILRILKLHKIGNIETLLYTVGLSVATLMFLGLFMDTVYPFLGISGPISITPLILTISAIVLVLCYLSYIGDKFFSDPSFIDINKVLSPAALFLCLIPFLAIFGAYLVNWYHNNTTSMFLIIILALIAILIAFDKFILLDLYPLAVFIIAISLLYHVSLISMYVWGWDIHYELYLTNLVEMNSIWNSSKYSTCNAMLSLVMLAPIYSIISDMSITWVFKVIYPFLFSLVPLCLYRVFQKQTDDRIAFVSCFFFMSLNIFYTELLSLARQQIAELFLVLLMLLMIDKNMNKMQRSFLFIVFGVSLIVSHYGLSYIYMFSLISAWLILVLAKNPEIQKLMNNFHFKFGSKNKPAWDPPSSNISSTFVLIFVTFTLAWYVYVSSSSAFDAVVHIGDHIVNSISTDFLNPEAAQGLKLVMAQPAPGLLHEINRGINYLNQIFIVIGGLVLILKPGVMKFESEYVAFSVVNLGLCFAGVSIPFVASSLNMTRLYHITLIFLAPSCVIGGITLFKVLGRVIRASWEDQLVNTRRSVNVLLVYFVIFLLYQTGFVSEAMEGCSGSILLNSTMDYPRFNDQEVLGAKWLTELGGDELIYADEYRWLLLGSFEWEQVSIVDQTWVPNDSYIYIGTWNIMNDEVAVVHTSGVTRIHEYINSEYIINDRNKIYANDGAEVYYR